MSTVIELANPSNTGNNNTNTTNHNNVNANNNNLNNNNVQTSHSEFQSNAVLQRMKEMEHQLQEMRNMINNLEVDNNAKDALIKKLEIDKEELSTERRKDMEQILETAVNDWLNSLKGISEEVRSQFKSGITSLAKKADIKNHAWEVICNASQAHVENVAKINELLTICQEKEKTIESLLQNSNDPQFKSTISRVAVPGPSSTSSGNKRPAENFTQDTIERDTKMAKNEDAWDNFATMISAAGKDQYF